MKKIGVAIIAIFTIMAISATPIFAMTVITASRNTSATSTLYSGQDGTVAVFVQGYSLNPYYEQVEHVGFDASHGYDKFLDVCQEYVFSIRVYNTTNDTYVFNRGLVGVTPQRSQYTTANGYNQLLNPGYEIVSVEGDLLGNTIITTGGAVQGYVNYNWTYSNFLCVPAKTSVFAFITVKTHQTYAYYSTSIDTSIPSANVFDQPISSITINYPESASINNEAYLTNANINSYYTQETVDDIYEEIVGLRSQITTLNNRIYSIMNNVQTITDAYTQNSSNVSDTQSTITEVGSEESQLHQAEVNYFLQNEQALQNVGISNFSFSSDQSSGLGAVVSDFSELWDNIGPLQIIFTFTLSMSLATYLLRHRPITGAIRQNERKK